MNWRDLQSPKRDEIERLASLEPHDLLSVDFDATAAEIRTAYRRLAKIYHPDKADPFMRSYNEEVIKIINRAYQQLMQRFDAAT